MSVPNWNLNSFLFLILTYINMYYLLNKGILSTQFLKMCPFVSLLISSKLQSKLVSHWILVVSFVYSWFSALTVNNQIELTARNVIKTRFLSCNYIRRRQWLLSRCSLWNVRFPHCSISSGYLDSRGQCLLQLTVSEYPGKLQYHFD